MTLLRTLPSFAAACGLALFAASGAQAQAQPPAGQHPDWSQHRAEMREHMEHARAEHLKLLHDALSIRPDQEAAWQAFAASMTPEPGEHREMNERAESEHRHMTTPERLDRMVEREQARLAKLQKHVAAVKTFYAALSPTQQRTFDALARLHMHEGFGHGGMRRDGMHHGMGGVGGHEPPAGE